MIPDKLYIPQLIYGTWQYQTPDPDDETQVEYIRKDKIREMVMYARNMSQTPDAAIRNWDLLIQKIDEL